MLMSFDRLSKQDRADMGQRLKAARYTAGITIRGVAAELGVNVASVTQWESGTVPIPETRARLAKLYDLDEDVLFAELAAQREAAKALLRPSA